jgi:cytochrome b
MATDFVAFTFILESGNMSSDASTPTTRIRLWDLPLRIFHWSLVVAVVVAIVTAEIGGNWMELHGKAGLAIIGLLAFRLSWGIVGSTHARFLNFVPSPARIHDYLKGKWEGVGHNPLGALSVFALLGLLAAQAATGLFANDDIAFNGPLFSLVDQLTSDHLTAWHHTLSNLLFILLGLHVLAVFFYVLFKKNNLLKPMVTGWKEIKSSRASANSPATTKGSFIGLVSSVVVAVVTVYGASSAGLADAPAAAPPAKVAAPAAW